MSQESDDNITDQRGWDFEAAAMPFVDSLYNTAYRMTRNSEDAQDLVQETYFKAYRHYDKFQEGTNFKAWLFKILKNSFINNYRKKQSRPCRATLPRSKTLRDQVSEEVTRTDQEPGRGASRGCPRRGRAEGHGRAAGRLRMAIVLADLEGFSLQGDRRDFGAATRHGDESSIPGT